MKFEEQRRRFGQTQLASQIHRMDLHGIEQFDPRHGNPELDRRDDRLHGALHRRKVTGGGGNAVKTMISRGLDGVEFVA